MPRLLRPALLDIIVSIDRIREATAGKTLSEYSSDWILKHAVERGIEIISEATRRLSREIGPQHPEIPWKQIGAIGNILRHEYDNVVDRVIFEVVQSDLAPLRELIATIEVGMDEPREE